MDVKISREDRLPNFQRYGFRACMKLHYYNPNLGTMGTDVSSVWNFSSHSSDFI